MRSTLKKTHIKTISTIAPETKILALVKGWRIRQIFRLTMTKSKGRIILDHDDLDTDFKPLDIKESRKNACRKFSDFVGSLEQYGGWVQLK
jgi:hypothetical protein